VIKSVQLGTVVASSELVYPEIVEEKVTRQIRKNAMIMNQVKDPSKGART